MKKIRNLLTISIAIVSLVFISYIVKKVTNIQISDLPNLNNISYLQLIDVKKEGNFIISNRDDVKVIYNSLLKAKKCITKESVNDVPSSDNKNLIKVVLKDHSDKSTTLFAYEAMDGSYYVEVPYVGIYSISTKEYETLTQLI